MSVRYGVAIIPEPSFTARVYRARQLICGQYASWAAEMHMLHLTVVGFFQCPEDAAESVAAGLGRVARETSRKGGVPLAHQGVATFPNVAGNKFLDFAVPEDIRPRTPRNLYALQSNVLEMLGEVYEVVPPNLHFTGDNYWPHITLMQRAALPPPVFESAVEFARAVVRDLEVPQTTRAWQLTLTRFESDAAGDDWDDGRWATDLRWKLLASYPL